MSQPEITFRHGLCSASIYENEYTRGEEKIHCPHGQLSAQLPGQRRQLADHQQLEGERYTESGVGSEQSL